MEVADIQLRNPGYHDDQSSIVCYLTSLPSQAFSWFSLVMIALGLFARNRVEGLDSSSLPRALFGE